MMTLASISIKGRRHVQVRCQKCGRIRQVRPSRLVGSVCRYCASGRPPSEQCRICGCQLSLINRSRLSACCVDCGNKQATKSSREWRSRNKKSVIEASRRWQKKNPEKVKEYSRRRKLRQYGMSKSDFDVLFVSQNGLCAICSKELTRPHIDHDHISGLVRGILCSSCNLMLGHAEDSTEVLMSAAKYLEASKCQ